MYSVLNKNSLTRLFGLTYMRPKTERIGDYYYRK